MNQHPQMDPQRAREIAAAQEEYRNGEMEALQKRIAEADRQRQMAAFAREVAATPPSTHKPKPTAVALAARMYSMGYRA